MSESSTNAIESLVGKRVVIKRYGRTSSDDYYAEGRITALATNENGEKIYKLKTGPGWSYWVKNVSSVYVIRETE